MKLLLIFIFTEIAIFGFSQVPQAPSNPVANTDMNWILAKSYDATGNTTGESKVFYDDGGQLLQTQSKVFYKDPVTGNYYIHVLATQPIRDVCDRNAITTLPAPLNNAEFSYKPDFVKNNDGSNYSYKNFDRYLNGTETDKTDNPDQVQGQATIGTLGWYYGIKNTWEPYVPVTNYPYTRQTYFRDGTGNIKKSAAEGTILKMGSGHETSSFITPVASELTHYLQVRNKFFTTNVVGTLPSTLQYQAIQINSTDANGSQVVTIQDNATNTLMTALAGGNDLTVSNSVSIVTGGFQYFSLFAASPVTITGSGSFTLYDMDNNAEPPVNFTSGNTLAAGYYKLNNSGSTTLTLSYTNNYSFVSYNIYNQLGQIVASIPPEGVKKLYGTGINNYNTKESIPFITLYEYDTQGRLTKVTDPDAGINEFVYRKDGKIRFSQNAVQKLDGSYSYTNYDTYGRPIEAGKYKPDANGIEFNSDLTASSGMSAILENTTTTGGLTTGTKSDVVMAQYDVVDNSYGLATYNQSEIYLRGAVSFTTKYSTIVNNSPQSTDIISKTWYNYDEMGDVVWKIVYINAMQSYTTVDFTFDADGKLIKQVFQKNNADQTFVHYYEYQRDGRLEKVSTNTMDNIDTKKLQARYIYYLHGPLKRIELAGDLQGIDYTYSVNGALKTINNGNKNQDPGVDGANGFYTDAFGEVLYYYDGDYTNGRTGTSTIRDMNTSSITPDNYNGMLKAISWFSKKPPGSGPETPNIYVYNYDSRYNFIESTWGTDLLFSNPGSFTPTNSYKEKIKDASGTSAYDGNDNMHYLQRTDVNGSVVDNLSYTYFTNTNKLQTVTDNEQAYANYSYDNIGELTAESDANPAISKYITYDVTGKVLQVFRDAAHTIKVVEYVYNEEGERIIKKNYNTTGILIQLTFYISGVIFTQNVTNNGTTYGSIVLQEYMIDGGGARLGTYYKQATIYAYEMRDQSGNIRAVIAETAGALDVRTYTDYYPYGLVLRQNGADYRYEYQGQYAEKDDETGWNAFDLRMYDAFIGRWLRRDPNHNGFSPYNAMGGDPVNKNDPSGGDVWVEQKDANGNGTGNVYWDPKIITSAQADAAGVIFRGTHYTIFDADDLNHILAEYNPDQTASFQELSPVFVRTEVAHYNLTTTYFTGNEFTFVATSQAGGNLPVDGINIDAGAGKIDLFGMRDNKFVVGGNQGGKFSYENHYGLDVFNIGYQHSNIYTYTVGGNGQPDVVHKDVGSFLFIKWTEEYHSNGVIINTTSFGWDLNTKGGVFGADRSYHYVFKKTVMTPTGW